MSRNEPESLIEHEYVSAVKAGRIYNGGVQCDNWNGPCACGAWHNLAEARGRLEPAKPSGHGRTKLTLVK